MIIILFIKLLFSIYYIINNLLNIIIYIKK